MSTDLFVEAKGAGDPLLFIHGSATTMETWTIQAMMLSKLRTTLTYDRRGTGKSPAAGQCSVEAHAEDAAQILRAHAKVPCTVIGSSFGGVIALELARTHPQLVRGLVICEPPLAPDDETPPVPEAFMEGFVKKRDTEGGEAAAEFFLRTVLSDEGFEGLSPRWKQRSLALHHQIWMDSVALSEYRVRYHSLHEIDRPVLLLCGERSPEYFGLTQRALQKVLSQASLQTLKRAGHMMQVEASRSFNAAVLEFDEAHPPKMT